jgi:hypothetical protein
MRLADTGMFVKGCGSRHSKWMDTRMGRWVVSCPGILHALCVRWMVDCMCKNEQWCQVVTPPNSKDWWLMLVGCV